MLKRVLMAMILAMAAAVPAAAFSDTADRVTLIIRFEASDEGRAEFAGIMDGVSQAMASEPGFVSAVVYRNTDNPNLFVLEEIWESRALHAEHFDRISASGDWAHINSLLIAVPQMGYYRIATGAE